MVTVYGVPVDRSKHPDLYRRKAEKENFSALSSEESPRVRMAEPPTGSVPREAQKSIDRFLRAGFVVRVTYGVCGHNHVGPDRGKCKTCEYVATPTIEQEMPKHIHSGRECTGRGEAPAKIIEFQEKGKTKRKGICPVCAESTTLSRTDKLMKHGPPCEGSGEAPREIVPGKPEPPEESIAVRVKGFGAAYWVNGAFEGAGIIENGVIRRVLVREWERHVKLAVAESV